jgi:ribonuclease-3
MLQALSHRSWCAEAGGEPSNERLEFLGDAVLGLIVAEHCYIAYPNLPEGALAQIRAAVVNTAVLADVGQDLGLGEFILLGHGEDTSGGRSKPSILANTVEALIAVSYLDGGLAQTIDLVLRLLGDRIVEAAAVPGAADHKTRLQEISARQFSELPKYRIEGSGPDHERRYVAHVSIGGEELGVGEGKSKKDAEQAAAKVAWSVVVDRASDTASAATMPGDDTVTGSVAAAGGNGGGSTVVDIKGSSLGGGRGDAGAS